MSAIRPELFEAVERIHAGSAWETLPGDASTRRFHRLRLAEGGTRIVMDYGAPFTGETDDVRLARIFERGQLPVARVLDILEEAGCLLLEDLGDVTLEVALVRAGGDAATVRAMYERAADLAADIAVRGTHALSSSERASGPALDAGRFRFEMGFFREHFVEEFLGRPPASRALVDALDALADAAAAHPRVLCHRDYHSRNLMVRGDGALAMVDIQDARWGPDTYDIASLLRDAYIDLEDRDVEVVLSRYIEAIGGPEGGEALRTRFHLAGTQRMIKALGTFGYQVGRLGRERYRDGIPRTIARLARLLPARPETERLAPLLSDAGLSL